jgi:hypothetical protein
MRFELSRLRKGPARPDIIDGRGQSFFAGPVVTVATDGQTPRISEVLHALPMVKVEGAAVTSTGQLSVLVKRAGGAQATPGWYASGTSLPVLPSLPGIEDQLLLARVGYRIQKLIIDDKVTPDGTAHDAAYWKILTAAYALLRELDNALARGTGVESVPRIRGLATLSSTSGRTVALQTPTSNLEPYLRRALGAITPNDCGPGGGPHCLIGSNKGMRRLMATAAGQSGSSGWRNDPVSGQFVYHYMGIPFYRSDIDETGSVSRIYAANLGPTGLNLVYTHGTPASFGLEVDDTSASTGTAVDEAVVHGAFALALWENEALFEISNIDVSGDP